MIKWISTIIYHYIYYTLLSIKDHFLLHLTTIQTSKTVIEESDETKYNIFNDVHSIEVPKIDAFIVVE